MKFQPTSKHVDLVAMLRAYVRQRTEQFHYDVRFGKKELVILFEPNLRQTIFLEK